MASSGRCDLVNAIYKCIPVQRQSNIRLILWFVRQSFTYVRKRKSPILMHQAYANLHFCMFVFLTVTEDILFEYLDLSPNADSEFLSGSGVAKEDDDDLTGGNLGMLEDALSELTGGKQEETNDEIAYDVRPNKVQPLNEMVCALCMLRMFVFSKIQNETKDHKYFVFSIFKKQQGNNRFGDILCFQRHFAVFQKYNVIRCRRMLKMETISLSRSVLKMSRV